VYAGSLLSRKVAKFLAVGMLNTLVGYGIYAAFLLLGFSYPVALLLATVGGVIFNYFSFGQVVFKAQHGWYVFVKFVLAYAVVYAVNATLLGLLIRVGHLNAYLAQGVCLVPSVALSWILMNLWIYREQPAK
jgi:putative flippase GtrA